LLARAHVSISHCNGSFTKWRGRWKHPGSSSIRTKIRLSHTTMKAITKFPYMQVATTYTPQKL
jgi:hypothetical protein